MPRRPPDLATTLKHYRFSSLELTLGACQRFPFLQEAFGMMLEIAHHLRARLHPSCFSAIYAYGADMVAVFLTKTNSNGYFLAGVARDGHVSAVTPLRYQETASVMPPLFPHFDLQRNCLPALSMSGFAS